MYHTLEKMLKYGGKVLTASMETHFTYDTFLVGYAALMMATSHQ